MGDYAKAEPLLPPGPGDHEAGAGRGPPRLCHQPEQPGLAVRVAWGITPGPSRCCRTALDITLRNLDLSAAAQSERQQLAMAHKLRYVLDTYLSSTSAARPIEAPAYRYVLAWKGAVFARQRRTLHGRDEPDAAPLYAEWQRTTHRLASLAFVVPEPKQQEAWRQQLAELTEKKEQTRGGLVPERRRVPHAARGSNAVHLRTFRRLCPRMPP